jgi:hypothetical protein
MLATEKGLERHFEATVDVLPACNVQKLRILRTSCICVFHMVLTVNMDYFPKQQSTLSPFLWRESVPFEVGAEHCPQAVCLLNYVVNCINVLKASFCVQRERKFAPTPPPPPPCISSTNIQMKVSLEKLKIDT